MAGGTGSRIEYSWCLAISNLSLKNGLTPWVSEKIVIKGGPFLTCIFDRELAHHVF